jgi:hypothetical protein
MGDVDIWLIVECYGEILVKLIQSNGASLEFNI